MDVREIYLDTALTFVRLVENITDEMWTRPGLGVWNVRDLTGHTSRALITVITYLDRPASAETMPNAVDYYVAAKALAAADSSAVTQRGRDAGIALGEIPAAAVGQMVDEVATKLRAVNGDPIIETIAGGMRLNNYLPTRVFELVVHGMDLARATNLEFTPPPIAIREMALLATGIGCALGSSVNILEALTGRTTLPVDFSVV